MIQRAYLGLDRRKSLDMHSSLNHYYCGIFSPLALITFAVCWQFLLSLHFTPLTEGWFTAYAEMSMSGSQRYLDYDLYLPPVYPIPNIPVAYLLSGRLPGGRVVVPWFDFLSDVGAVREANRLLVDAPDTIVLLEMSDTVIASHERLFRSGHSSGQRSLHQVLYEYCFSTRRYNIVL
jgi:hypothetical protein